MSYLCSRLMFVFWGLMIVLPAASSSLMSPPLQGEAVCACCGVCRAACVLTSVRRCVMRRLSVSVLASLRTTSQETQSAALLDSRRTRGSLLSKPPENRERTMKNTGGQGATEREHRRTQGATEENTGEHREQQRRTQENKREQSVGVCSY